MCGNTEFNSTSASCEYFIVGSVAVGVYQDWVLHVRLAHGDPVGFVRLWRNNVLMVNASDLLTSFNDATPPYMKIGSYNVAWKDGRYTKTQVCALTGKMCVHLCIR